MALRKQLWWMALTSCAGISTLLIFPLGGAIVELAQGMHSPRSVSAFGLLLAGEVAGAWVAVRKLKRCYAQEPMGGAGRWQLSLSDMIAIVFFFGIVMLFCQKLSPAGFGYVGIPISLLLGCGFVAAMFVVARTESLERTLERCFVAFCFLGSGIIVVVISVLIQMIVLAVVSGFLKLALG